MTERLNTEAENVRKEIKQMILETATGDVDNLTKAERFHSDDGRILYSGAPLHDLVKTLRHHLNLDDGLGFTVWHFTVGRPIINDKREMYIVPLSDNCNIMPAERLIEGTVVRVIDGKPVLSPKATFVMFMR